MKIQLKSIVSAAICGFVLLLGDPSEPALIPTEVAKLLASDGAAGDRFGQSVAISGDTAVISAFGNDDAGRLSGSAYVFTRTGTTWTEQAKLTASDAAELDIFGISVAVSGDTAVIGATQAGFGTAIAGAGSAYVFSLATEVKIDIQPFGKPNKPNRIKVRGSLGVVKVAILSTNIADGDSVDFDALQVDAETVEFGPNGAPAKRRGVKAKDVDDDGDVDLILLFKMRRTGLSCADSEATLTGETYAGEPFTGSDSILPSPCP